MEGKGGLVRVHFLVIFFFFFKPLAPWWSFDDFCQSCVTIDIIRSTEFRLYLRFFTFIWILFQFLISIDREYQYNYDKSRTYMMHLPFFFLFVSLRNFVYWKDSIIVSCGWQTPKRYDTGWNREWTRLVKKAEDWYHMDCKWQTLKLQAKFIKNLKLWRSSFNVFPKTSEVRETDPHGWTVFW